MSAVATPLSIHLAGASLAAKDVLSVCDLTAEEIVGVLELAAEIKADPTIGLGALSGKHVVMLFEKPSLRTRMSFEVGLSKLGAHAMYFDHQASRIGERESIKDYAKNLERWVDGLIARVYDHATLAGLGEHAAVPVLNALSDLEHPCQALADFQTLGEALGGLGGAKLAYVGDGANVCHSLMLMAASLGVDMTVVTPKGFEPKFGVIQRAGLLAAATGASLTVSHSLDAIAGHHAVYTDAWLSMGQGHQQAIRDGVFNHLQVDEDLMEVASSGLEAPAHFMHCLPAHRGEEVVDEVIDSASSLVYEQAENRMHAQMALLLKLYGAG